MKLKKAIKIARKMGLKWVSVDEDQTIYAYNSKPYAEGSRWRRIFEDIPEADDGIILGVLGKYTGGKFWEETLRRVK